MIVNAEGQILGRLSTFVAKKALLGEEMIVVNAEKAIISGGKGDISARELAKLNIKNIGNYRKGPFHQRRPDRVVRKSIRGMLPYKKTRGKEAFERVMVYIGIPENEIKKNHNINVKKTKIQNLKLKKEVKGISVGELCSSIGGKWRR